MYYFVRDVDNFIFDIAKENGWDFPDNEPTFIEGFPHVDIFIDNKKILRTSLRGAGQPEISPLEAIAILKNKE